MACLMTRAGFFIICTVVILNFGFVYCGKGKAKGALEPVHRKTETEEGSAEKDKESESDTTESTHSEINDEPICSVHDLDPAKTCISIKFPWKEDSVYFCTENEHLTYTTTCGESNSMTFCNHAAGKDDLKISTPWDCCPFVSKPNQCEGHTCSPAPFNRTCESTKKQHECCASYYCEKGSPATCKMKMTKSKCINPPKGKQNCTTFIDPYGCCNKFQCLGEGKKGDCPQHGKGHQFQTKIMNGASKMHHSDFVMNGKQNLHYDEPLKCTGDYTCPGKLKCCPQNSYFQKMKRGKGKKQKAPKVVPVHGICVAPENVESEEDSSGEKSKETEGSGSVEETETVENKKGKKEEFD